MQSMILTLALITVPAVQHSLENPTNFKPKFAGEMKLISTHCWADAPFHYLVIPGPSVLPTMTIATCVPKQGENAIEIVCFPEGTCVAYETKETILELAIFIKSWLEKSL